MTVLTHPFIVSYSGHKVVARGFVTGHFWDKLAMCSEPVHYHGFEAAGEVAFCRSEHHEPILLYKEPSGGENQQYEVKISGWSESIIGYSTPELLSHLGVSTLVEEAETGGKLWMGVVFIRGEEPQGLNFQYCLASNALRDNDQELTVTIMKN